MPPTQDELDELEELKALLGKGPERDSAVPAGAVSRFMVGEENRKRAEDARREKEERDALKNEVTQKRLAAAEKLRQETMDRRERDRAKREEARQRKLAEGREMVQKKANWKEEAARKDKITYDRGAKLVAEENERFKRMNVAEAAQDKLEREEGTRDRKAVEAAFKAEREATLEAKRQQVQKVRQMTQPSIIEEALQWAAEKREKAAEARREEKAKLQEARRGVQESHLNYSKDIKSQVNAVKENVKAVQDEVLKAKQAHASKERDNDYLVQQEKIRVLADKKRAHQNVYQHKYASHTAAASWVGASTLRRGGPKRDVSPPRD